MKTDNQCLSAWFFARIKENGDIMHGEQQQEDYQLQAQETSE
jgi:hypothetical protein